MDTVVPDHPQDYFMVNKEKYFFGRNRILREKQKRLREKRLQEQIDEVDLEEQVEI